MRGLALALLIGMAAQATAQRAPVLKLAPANATHPEEFTHIAALRELADGRVLVVDERYTRLVVADFRAGSLTAIGRVGNGPGEYRILTGLHPLAADSTLVIDSQGRRWLLLAGSTIVATIPTEDPVKLKVGAPVVGTDARGRIVSKGSLPPILGADGVALRNNVLLVTDRATLRVDTLGPMRGDATKNSPTKLPSGAVMQMLMQVVFAVPDQAAVYPDGSIAIVRQDPYAVEWIDARGGRVRGAPIVWTPVPVTDAEKDGHTERLKRRLGPKVQFPPAMPYAEVIGPFPKDAVLAMPDGAVLVLKSQSIASPNNRYDIIDRAGRVAATMELPWNQRVVGFGRDEVYVAVLDDDGIEHLQRHPKLR